MTTWITICDTCKRDGWENGEMELSDGEQLAKLIEKNCQDSPVKTRRVSCLMGCIHGCNISIQAPKKISYTLGAFEPSQEAADGIVEYARCHAASDTGQVPFKQWPQSIKGHFITRHQPLPDEQ